MIERFFTDSAPVGSTYRAHAGRSKKIAFAMGFAILDSVVKLSLLAVVAARGVGFAPRESAAMGATGRSESLGGSNLAIPYGMSLAASSVLWPAVERNTSRAGAVDKHISQDKNTRNRVREKNHKLRSRQAVSTQDFLYQ
jgi:hypothetical protein